MGLWPLKRYIFYVQCVLQIDPTKENKKRVIASSFFPTPRIPMALQPAANLHMNLGCVTIEASGMGCKRRGGGGGQGGGVKPDADCDGPQDETLLLILTQRHNISLTERSKNGG